MDKQIVIVQNEENSVKSKAFFESFNQEFDYIDDCLKAATEANELFKQLALSVGWGDLKILQLQDEILEALEYKSENIDKLQNAYELIFHDYIANSAKFFPTQLQNQILDFYS